MELLIIALHIIAGRYAGPAGTGPGKVSPAVRDSAPEINTNLSPDTASSGGDASPGTYPGLTQDPGGATGTPGTRGLQTATAAGDNELTTRRAIV